VQPQTLSRRLRLPVAVRCQPQAVRLAQDVELVLLSPVPLW